MISGSRREGQGSKTQKKGSQYWISHHYSQSHGIFWRTYNHPGNGRGWQLSISGCPLCRHTSREALRQVARMRERKVVLSGRAYTKLVEAFLKVVVTSGLRKKRGWEALKLHKDGSIQGLFPLVLTLPVGGKDPDGTEGPGFWHADCLMLWKASIRYNPDTELVQFFNKFNLLLQAFSPKTKEST